MKKLLLILGISLSITISAQAANKIAIVNMSILLQQIAQKTGVPEKLENEFKNRANELQNMENDLQKKIQRLQRDDYTMKINERKQLENEIASDRHLLFKKAQNFETDHHRRSNEEHSKLISYIHTLVKEIADCKNIDLVFDSHSIAFNNSNIENITSDVVKRIN